MNWDRIEGNWKQFTGKAKSQWGKLNDDVLTQVGGRRDQLVGKIQESYGISKDEAEHQVQEWSSSLEDGHGTGRQGAPSQSGAQGQQAQSGDGPGMQGHSGEGATTEDWEQVSRAAAANVGRWAGEARRGVEQRTKALEARVHQQPFGALAVAAAAGFILGVLCSRR